MTQNFEYDIGDLPAEELEAQVRSVLEHAIDAHRRGLKVYESLQNLSEVIGTEYGDRVLYELLQNAHDAHGSSDEGRIAIRLIVQSPTEGVLYIANGGSGFRRKDVEAIRNLAISAKEVGEGIGNKGLGFRSIEALTDDVRIFSRRSAQQSAQFDGYCFRFAYAGEIEKILRSFDVESSVGREVANTVPRYLVPRPLKQQPDGVVSYARRGYATVIVAPLRTAEAVALATTQVEALAELDVPLLLFLDRIAEIRIDVETPDQRPYGRRLHRRQTSICDVPELIGTRMYEVDVGEGRRFLVVQREVDKERVREAVQRSIPKAPQLKRWLNWKGQPVVSIAVGLSKSTVAEGRLYNFLPMGEEAASPLMGYLDAPFFADINRRNASLDLPLNETLMEAAAEACVAAALALVTHDLSVSQQAVFDLIAWTGDQAGKVDNALTEAGSSLREATVIPAIAVEDKSRWASLSEVSIWPEGTFSILKAGDVAKRVGARLVSSALDGNRLGRLREIASRISRPLSPSAERLTAWSERFARSLGARKAAPQTWSRFYEDLNRVFKAANVKVEALAGKLILYDRSGKLRPAGGHNGTSGAGVFVRRESSRHRRAKGDVPLPPSTLIRRYRFLDEKITFRRETLEAFIKADLIREYDPVEALAGLKSALRENANYNRRKEALLWAFQVWRTAGARVEEKLKIADLRVPTLAGWQPAVCAAFSSSWTPVGQTLENFLVEAADISSDCRRARDLLLVGYQDWPNPRGETKRRWVDFLELIGVADGLRPVAVNVPRCGSPADTWHGLLRSGKASEGLDSDWCAEALHVSFEHPNTDDYRIKDEVWRLPGQIEHEDLPETAREAFCALAFDHIKAHGTEFFEFEIGRFDRSYRREWDHRRLPTPLATFLRSKPWIAANTQEGLGFRRAGDCWAARVRRGGLPGFMDRVPDTVANFGGGAEFAELVFGDELGVQDWQSKDTAVERLKDLASVSTTLASSDRPVFRREYQRAWFDVVEKGVSLPNDLSLAVDRRGQLEALSGDIEASPNVIVTPDAQRFEARILSSAGQAVLEVGEASAKKVTDLLEATGGYVPRRLDGIGVRLLVDGEHFVPRVSDAPLTSCGLSWLPEVTVLGHELRGEQLERGIQSATVERRVRAIRIRRGRAITLVVDGEEVSTAEHMAWYAVEHETLPTLILTDALSLDWKTLANSLSGPISRLIDSRLRSLEPALLHLALDQVSDVLDAPSDEMLAKALKCDVQTVQDHRAALRTGFGHILHLLTPVVAYFKGAELARLFQSDADRAGVKFDVANWLRKSLFDVAHSPENLIDTCERASDRAALRRELDLDYARFNRVLLELGAAPLSNEAELRQLYDAYLGQMRPSIIDRLRRHHRSDFHNGLDLTAYVSRKTLAFLPFDQAWVLTRETLEMEIVESHVAKLLTESLGEDPAVELPGLKRLVERNRRLIREFATCAIPIVSVWCRSNEVSVPGPWQQGDSQSVSRHLENSGLLDFEPLSAEQAPGLCRRSACWPNGMPETLDGTLLGLNENEVEHEGKRRDKERQQREIERRSIEFGGHSLDTGDSSFAERLQQLAEDCISSDDTWFERSRQRTKLVEFDTPGRSSRGGSRSGKSRGVRKLTDMQRQAMGLASEWLAFQFLLRRRSELVDETCWVSRNRTRFLGGADGDDALGFDFCVKAPRVDWLYEVKSSLEDTGEIELTANELRVASSASKDGRQRYRILYVPFVFSPERWCVLELPNPMGETTRNRFAVVGRGSVRLRFERQ